MCRLKTFLISFILPVVSVCLSVRAEEILLDGHQFSPFSKNVSRTGQHEARLLSLGSSSYAIYEFSVPEDLLTFSASAEIRNPKRREVDIYVWNYGDRQESPLLSKDDIDPHWIRWETCLVDRHWQTRSPEYLSARSGSGIIDFTGDYRLIKLMFYADKGLPPDTDELFFIRQVSLRSTSHGGLFARVEKVGKGVWVEGDLLMAEGIGHPSKKEESQASERVMAHRAALVIAYRNLARVMGNVEEDASLRQISGMVRGVKERESENLPDGGVRVVVEIPLKEALRRYQEMNH